MATILFFDDLALDRRDNVLRKVGRAKLIPESVYRDSYVNTHFGYPAVFRNLDGEWRMLYQGRNQGEPNPKLLAESDDGLRWKPYDTSRAIDLPDRRFPHQLFPLEQFGQWHCYVDPLGKPEERIKALVGDNTAQNEPCLLLSADGLHWEIKRGTPWHKSPPDPLTSVFYNEVRGSYVIATRPSGGDRRISLVETRDWAKFSEPELALQADGLDAPLAQTYGMPVFPYEGYFIGLLWLFHCVPEPSRKYLNGHVDCQLSYSINGWHFLRGKRDTFVPNGEPGSPDSGCVYPSSMITLEDGSLRFYASACTREHGNVLPDTGSLVAYSLRRHGFTFLESAAGVGVIGTRPLYWKTGDLALNVQSQGGSVRVQVSEPDTTPLKGFSFDQCQPFTGDDTSWQPIWKDGKSLRQLGDRAIRLEVELYSARLYAITGDFVLRFGRDFKQFVAESVSESRIESSSKRSSGKA